MLVGVTYLFAIARANGTTDWLVAAAVRLVGGRLALIPWVMFVVTGALTAIGAVSPAACAIVAPIALGFAARYGISPLLMGAMVVHGAQGGGFSPISVYGSIVNGIVERNHLPGNPGVLFLASLAMNTAIAAVLFVVLGGLKLSNAKQLAAVGAEVDSQDADHAEGGTDPTPTGDPVRSEPPVRLDLAKSATLVGLLTLVVGTLVFDLDIGLTAITLAVVLSVLWPADTKKAVTEITWPTVLLICGVLTYVAVLQEIGTHV